MIFVTSWDDGHVLDERLAELLDRFALKATFFVPIHNREDLPVMSGDVLRRLDKRFELGSHTLDHALLTKISDTQCTHQVVEGKAALEQQLGHAVLGFCYPCGKLNERVRKTVARAGFAYARTTENLRFDFGGDLFSIPTSIQVFPHGAQVLLRNFLRFGHYNLRLHALRIVLQSENWLDFIIKLLNAESEENSVIHVWGHSWEIEKLGLWAQLNELFSQVRSRKPKLCSVKELVYKETYLIP